MKAKYLVYLVIISLILRIGLNLLMPIIVTKIEPLTFGFIGGGINTLLFLSILGLLIKIFSYHNKIDFLNS